MSVLTPRLGTTVSTAFMPEFASVVTVGEDIAGASLQITDRVAALARPAEILVSRTVKDLVTGSDITFAERGSHPLNGAPDEWPLFAVTGFGRQE